MDEAFKRAREEINETTMIFQVPSAIHKIQTLVDGGVKLFVITQELSPDEMAILFSLKNKIGWFLFKEQPIKEEDLEVPEVDIEVGEKTPSQRLRAILYVIWEKSKPTSTFDEFYRQKMEMLINWLKEKYLE